MENKINKFVRELMKGSSEEEILEAEENFREYLKVVWQISQRIDREKEGKDSDLDDDDLNPFAL